jgi:hypothetical protein
MMMMMVKRKFGWIGHTLRKDDSEQCKAALQWNLQGTRARGRPKNSWRRTTLNESGKHSWSDLRFFTRSREGWRRFVDNLCCRWNYGFCCCCYCYYHYYYYYYYILYTVRLKSSRTMSVKIKNMYYLSVQHSPLVNQYTIYNARTMTGSFS